MSIEARFAAVFYKMCMIVRAGSFGSLHIMAGFSDPKPIECRSIYWPPDKFSWTIAGVKTIWCEVLCAKIWTLTRLPAILKPTFHSPTYYKLSDPLHARPTFQYGGQHASTMESSVSSDLYTHVNIWITASKYHRMLVTRARI